MANKDNTTTIIILGAIGLLLLSKAKQNPFTAQQSKLGRIGGGNNWCTRLSDVCWLCKLVPRDGFPEGDCQCTRGPFCGN